MDKQKLNEEECEFCVSMFRCVICSIFCTERTTDKINRVYREYGAGRSLADKEPGDGH